MDEEYFRSQIAKIDAKIQSRLEKLKNEPLVYTKPEVFFRSNARERLQQVLLSYSVGDDIPVVSKRWALALEAIDTYFAKVPTEKFNFQDLDDYLTALWMLSLGILFAAEESSLTRLLGLIGNVGQDALFEWLVASRFPKRNQATHLLHPKIFSNLVAVFDAAPVDRPKLLEKYLNGWYGKMAKTYWHDSHKGPGGGGFFGYWSIESAAVCKIAGIDVKQVGELRHMPLALVLENPFFNH